MLSTLFPFLLFYNDTTITSKIDESFSCVKSKQVRAKLVQAMIEYDDMTYTVFSKILYSPNKLSITTDGVYIINKEIDDNDTVQIIQSYLQQFYVDKSEKIELNRIKIEGPITGEYSTIKVTLYFKDGNSEVFSNNIGLEDYIIEYNPKFESFLKFLEEVVNYKNR